MKPAIGAVLHRTMEVHRFADVEITFTYDAL